VDKNFNKVALWVYQLTVGCKKPPVVVDFLQTEGYKVLSSDYQDTIISDLASLKNGVARAHMIEAILTQE